jgi:hypothetical protein
MSGVPLAWYLILSAVLFSLGIAGFLFRKSVITIFMSIELMLNAVNLSFVAFSYLLQQVNGRGSSRGSSHYFDRIQEPHDPKRRRNEQHEKLSAENVPGSTQIFPAPRR